MAVYSIRDLEQLSGIKAHTLRVWEQRYGIIQPKRTDSNIRYYLDEDLQLVLNIALLNKNGWKISKIAKMSQQKIADYVKEITSEYDNNETLIEALTITMLELDELRFSKILEGYKKKRGFEKTMLELVYPFLEKLSMLWLTGSVKPIHENFITHLIRQKVLAAIDQLPITTPKKKKRFFLYLPPGEKQELSLLFLNFLLKKEGFSIFYLGQETTIADLKDAHAIQPADFIFTIITETFTKESVQHYINTLSENFADTQLLLTGYQIATQNITPPDNVRLIFSLNETLSYLKGLEG